MLCLRVLDATCFELTVLMLLMQQSVVMLLDLSIIPVRYVPLHPTALNFRNEESEQNNSSSKTFILIIALFCKHIWFPFVHNCCRKVFLDDMKWPRSIFSIVSCIQICRFNCTDLRAFSITSVSLIYS